MAIEKEYTLKLSTEQAQANIDELNQSLKLQEDLIDADTEPIASKKVVESKKNKRTSRKKMLSDSPTACIIEVPEDEKKESEPRRRESRRVASKVEPKLKLDAKSKVKPKSKVEPKPKADCKWEVGVVPQES